jgi:hypothetical protein
MWYRATLTAAALCLALLSVAAAAARRAQTPAAAAPTLGDAQARLQANDPAGAIALLERLTALRPGEADAWQLLGAAHRQAKQADRALAAYQRALALQPAPQLFFDIAAAHALGGDVDAAFEWLSKAHGSRKVDMSQVDADADLAALRADPRLARLRPIDADFADPFVEPVRILREWRGEAANDQFGWIARNIGDVDGDRIADIVTSAPTYARRGAAAGRVYVYSTATGALRWTDDGEPGDRLGIGVEGAGDINRDGVPDVIAAAPGGGYARLYSGRDGARLHTLTAEQKSDGFGRHVAGAGDVNGDGYADVIVGAPGNDAGGDGAGRAYVYSGKDARLLLTLTGERAGDGFGSAVAGYARGSVRLLLVGAPGAGATRAGRTYVYTALTASPQFVIEADETGAALGAMFLSVPGDVDGDGTPDVYASDFSNAARGPSTGRIVVHSGRDGRRLLTLTGETAGEGFGTSPSPAGDVDGDGHADLIVGAWQYSGAAPGGGRAYLYSGRTGALIRTFTCRIPGDTFGFDAVEIGDVDGDGMTDLLITSAWSGVRGFHSGRMFVLSSGVRR